MKILLSNDDGVSAPGLHRMADALRPLGEVYICAPEGPRSGASSSLTLYQPLLVTEVAERCWSVSGNPADAVKLALNELVGSRPDVVVSGINNGLNCGANVLYSGTVAAALEGAQAGVTSFAVSRRASADEDCRAEARLAAKIIGRLAKRHPRSAVVFNLNIPPGRPKGIKATVTERTPYVDRYDQRTDPRGRTYYWLRGEPPRSACRDGPCTDEWAVANGWCSVTPLRRDLTDPSLVASLESLFDGKG